MNRQGGRGREGEGQRVLKSSNRTFRDRYLGVWKKPGRGRGVVKETCAEEFNSRSRCVEDAMWCEQVH